MCLAVPMLITALDGVDATIESDGLVQRASLMLVPDAKVGDYVLVHAGYALTVMDAAEAGERLELFAEIEAFESGLADDSPGPAADESGPGPAAGTTDA